MHPFLLHNGKIRDTREPLLSPGQIGYLNGWGIFSTLRVTQGVLFAFERHYRRMEHDAQRLRVPFDITQEQLDAQLTELIRANGADDATLRVCVVRNTGGVFETPDQTRATDLIAFTSPLRDWGAAVRLSYVPNARYGASPFSGAKITSWAQNLTWYEQAHADGFDEVVLLNENGQVSECTSANIFAIRNKFVITPPLATSGCLPGVTRAILLQELQIPGFRVIEQELTPSELETSDGVFITSTTRDLLPVAEIDGHQLSQSPAVIAELRRHFQQYRATYVSERLAAKKPLLV